MLRGWTSRLAVVLGVAAAGGTLTGCELAVSTLSAEARETWTRTYQLPPDGRFELANTNGSITVEPSPDDAVRVTAEKVAKSASEEAAREVLEQVVIAESVDGAVVRLATKSPRLGMFGGSTHVTYTVLVPPSVAVKVENTNGRIDLIDLRGPVDAATTNGGVRGRNLRGPVRVETTNGGVELDLADVGGAVEASTTNGGVRVLLPAGAKADLSAQTTNGGIDAERLDLETFESSRRRLEARLNGGGPKIQAETTNGGIRFAAR
jgi:hypothetical protein